MHLLGAVECVGTSCVFVRDEASGGRGGAQLAGGTARFRKRTRSECKVGA
jgi:hypothetical protein